MFPQIAGSRGSRCRGAHPHNHRLPQSMSHSIEREIHISTPLPSLARELSLNIFRTDQFLTQKLQEVLRPADLRLDEYNVLRILRGAGTTGHQRADIEQRMVHDPDRLLA